MPFGQLVIGPPGSGKSTYCYGVLQFLTALKRPVIIVNLDPAAPAAPYPSSISITSLISLSDAMEAFSLGPNGGMLYCLEYLEKNLSWLEGELERAMEEMGWVGDRREEAYVVFDTPGQVELSTDHGSLRRIVDSLAKKGGWRVRRLLCERRELADPRGLISQARCRAPYGRTPHHGCIKIRRFTPVVPSHDAANGTPARQRPEQGRPLGTSWRLA